LGNVCVRVIEEKSFVFVVCGRLVVLFFSGFDFTWVILWGRLSILVDDWWCARLVKVLLYFMWVAVPSLPALLRLNSFGTPVGVLF